MGSRYIQPVAKVLLLIIMLVIPLKGMLTEVPPMEKPRSEFPFAVLADTIIDLGTLERGKQAAGTITLTNTGAKPLLIGMVRSSCGLMTPSWPAKPIGAGHQATISFRYDSNQPGPFERIITIHTNAWQKTLQVKVTGEIVTPVPEMPY
ncbi:MAG: DUF1573 domain-containing protein [Bacteroidales bacterium]